VREEWTHLYCVFKTAIVNFVRPLRLRYHIDQTSIYAKQQQQHIDSQVNILLRLLAYYISTSYILMMCFK